MERAYYSNLCENRKNSYRDKYSTLPTHEINNVFNTDIVYPSSYIPVPVLPTDDLLSPYCCENNLIPNSFENCCTNPPPPSHIPGGTIVTPSMSTGYYYSQLPYSILQRSAVVPSINSACCLNEKKYFHKNRWEGKYDLKTKGWYDPWKNHKKHRF